MVAETEQQRSQNGVAFAKLLGKAWSDPAAKQKLLADPKAALASVGFVVPASAAVKVLENTDRLMHVVDHPGSKTARFAGKDPKAVLAAEGLAIPAGVAVNVVENTEKLIHLVLPLPPSTTEISEEELEKVAGGAAGGPSIIRGYY